MKKFLRFLMITGIIVVVFYLSYILILNEYFEYRNTTRGCFSTRLYSTPPYLAKYPEGYWAEETMDFWKKCDYQDVMTYFTLRKINNFREKFPGSEYDEEMAGYQDSIWQEMRNTYQRSIENSNADPQAVEFFNELLEYLKANNKSTVFVRLSGNTVLKDYEEYSEFVRSGLAITYTVPPLEENLVGLTRNFSSGSLKDLNEILDRGVKSSFRKLFGDQFLTVQSYRDPESTAYKPEDQLNTQEDDVVIEVEYEIVNQEISGYPVVWSYSEQDVIKAYLLGINIHFDFNLKLPSSEKKYAFSKTEDAGESFSTQAGLQTAYSTMTRITFQHFANDISGEFGLSPAYYKSQIK